MLSRFSITIHPSNTYHHPFVNDGCMLLSWHFLHECNMLYKRKSNCAIFCAIFFCHSRSLPTSFSNHVPFFSDFSSLMLFIYKFISLIWMWLRCGYHSLDFSLTECRLSLVLSREREERHCKIGQGNPLLCQYLVENSLRVVIKSCEASMTFCSTALWS